MPRRCIHLSPIAAMSLLFFASVAFFPLRAQTSNPSMQEAAREKALIQRYCVTCHSNRVHTAGLSLEAVNYDDLSGSAEVWEKVVQKINAGEMPPAKMARPDSAATVHLIHWLENGLDQAAAAKPNPGRVGVHRLNRAEYANAVRDLLGIEVDGRSMLPPDDSGYGFDNIADVLSVSPALLARYLSAAAQISRMAVGDPKIPPSIQTYTVSPKLLQDSRMSEDLPFGSRGGIALLHEFPLDGEYLIKVRLQRTHADQIRGVNQRNQIELRLDRKRIKLFSVGGDGPLNPWSPQPNPSEYERTADEGMEVRIPVKAGPRLIGVSFIQQNAMPEGVLEPRLSVSTYEFAGDRYDQMRIYSVQVRGPYEGETPHDTATRQRIFICTPARGDQEEPCARKILTALARRAYRRPAKENELQVLLKQYQTGRAKGSFDSGIELALQTILVDPNFLFRIERDPPQIPPGKPYRVSDLELASRLSFFLWSSIPDEELLTLAERGKLRDPGVLDQQVRRMLRDERSSALVQNFGGQWLYLRNMRSVTPDPNAFPDFDDELRTAFERETEMFLEDQIREDHPLSDLLTANYTFINERLARHYGIPGIYGSHFRKVTFAAQNPRGGLLAQGSILTATSYPARTAPTLRGKWVLQNLLGSPPPPPPANVPALETTGEGKVLSVRERMEQHRANPVCASCHARMDPIGFSLENFDAIGTFRTREGTLPIDASGIFPDGTVFDGADGLRRVLLRNREEFDRTVIDKLLTYALGRGTEYYDAPAIRKIMRDAADERWSSVILGIVKSAPFQMRRSREQ